MARNKTMANANINISRKTKQELVAERQQKQVQHQARKVGVPEYVMRNALRAQARIKTRMAKEMK